MKSLLAGQDATGRCSLVPVNPVTDNIPPNSTVTLQMLSSQTMVTISTKVDTPVSGKRDLDLLNIYPSGGNDQDSRNVLFSSISEKIGAPYDSNSPAIASVIIKNVNTAQVGTFDTRFSKLTPSVSGTCHADIAGVDDKNIICKLNNVGDNSVSITINPLSLSK